MKSVHDIGRTRSAALTDTSPLDAGDHVPTQPAKSIPLGPTQVWSLQSSSVALPKSIAAFIEGPFKNAFEDFRTGKFITSRSGIEGARELICGLDRNALASLRSLLIRSVGRGRTKHAALRGPPTIQKVLQVLTGAPWSERLDPVTKRFVRSARDQNVDALMARSALTLVNGNQGAFNRLNPNRVPIALLDTPVGSVEQRYLLIDLFRDMMRVGYSEVELDAFVAKALADAKDRAPDASAQAAVAQLLGAGRMQVVARQRGCDDLPLPPGMRVADASDAQQRLSRVRWVEEELEKIAPGFITQLKSYRTDLADLFSEPTPDAVFEALDQRFENVMNEALGRDLHPTALTHLSSVAFERRTVDDVPAPVDVDAARAKDDHPVRRALHDLEERLARGEKSAVGGADYAAQTFPEEILEAASAKRITVVAFDGAREAGIDYIRRAYGTEDGVCQGCRIMGLQGIYGSYPRSLVTLDDGSQFLLVTGYGASRQLNNSAMLMLFEGQQGRICPDDIDLASDGGDRVAQLKQDIASAIERDAATARESILGVSVADNAAIPTRLMIIQNPHHLEQSMPGRFEWGKEPTDTLVPMRLAYVKKDDGTLERIIVPKVGGGGVYGDTAGAFVTAFFGLDGMTLIDDVIFNGATGGFANTRQIPDVSPGGLIAPTKHVEEYGDGVGMMPLPTLLAGDPKSWPTAVQRAVANAKVCLTENHVAVPAPSIETFELVHELVANDHASVDVEAGAIVRAVAALRESGRNVTFTPVYTHSDDPRHSEHDRFDSLAMMGPLFEGSRFDKPLFDVLQTLAGWTGA